MSEEKELPDGVVEADTVKVSEPVSEDRSKDEKQHEEDKDNLPMSQSDTALLEDEEMPTYVSMSTTSKCEDSDGSTARQVDEQLSPEKTRSPTTSEQGGAAIVYVLSSGEESDPHYNDEDEEDYGESDEMDNIDLEHEHENAMLDEEEEEDEDDREEEDDDDDDDNVDEFEMNSFETASDCVGMRSSLKGYNKDKSLSLQDLSICKNNIRDSNIEKRQRYRHVESKVKRYIHQIKEQNRYSLEKRLKNEEHAVNKNAEIKDIDTEQSRSLAVTNNKVIKEYVERAIKDLETEENGQRGNNHKNNSKNVELDIRVKNPLHYEDKNEHFKRNGTMQSNMQNHTCYQHPLQKNTKITALNEPLMNGHQQALTFFNLRTLSYEEYMQGSGYFSQEMHSNKNKQSDGQDDNYPENCKETLNVPENESNSMSYPLKIENVKSIRTMSDESKDNTEQLKFFKTSEENMKNQLSLLKTQLDQKTVQFNSLKEAYQNTLTENSSMKQQLEHLKMCLSKYEKEHQTIEKKVAAVQTDPITEISNEDVVVDGKQQSSNKISTSSIGSTASSTNQWTESACSSGIFTKPPDLATILPSDDSILTAENTPRKIAHPISRTFVTSSRILQTLSNITRGKAKCDVKSSPLIFDSSKIKSNANEENNDGKNNDASIITGSFAQNPTSNKKRKAAEMLGSSTFPQPSKIPHMNTESRKKPDEQLESGNAENEKTGESESYENEQTGGVENVEFEGGKFKCYVYGEDDNTEDRSFLIQAEEPKDSNEVDYVPECGPYLLGNVEVRMSKVNGIINIWGKEISQESISAENEEEANVPLKSLNNSKCPCSWQKSPYRKYNSSQIVCSTSKKPKMQPICKEVHDCEYAHLSERFDTKLHVECRNNLVSSSCERCSLANQPKECSTHRRVSNAHEKSHSHSRCINSAEYIEKECKCMYDYERRINNNENLCCTKEKCCNKSTHKCVLRNVTDTDKDCFEHTVNAVIDGTKEGNCKHHVIYRRHSLHNPEECLQNEVKCCNTPREAQHVCKSGNSSHQDSSFTRPCGSMNDDDDEMLLPSKRNSKTPDVRQRRSNGRRVKGILMDLLKSCGDYRNSHTNSSKRCSVEKNIPCSGDCSAKVNTPCTTSDTAHINSQQPPGRCCHAYTRRIESQLEEFRIEMERVRSRSDAILNMLTMLNTVETN